MGQRTSVLSHRAEKVTEKPVEGTNPGTESRPRWWRSLGFWRAVSGMGVSLALAATIVAAEFSSTLIHRTRTMSHRIATLNAESGRLKRRLTVAERRLIAMRAAAVKDETLKRVLTADDVQIIRLVAPGAAAKGATPAVTQPASSAPARIAAATLVVSRSANSAVLQATGLEPSRQDQEYRMWWLIPHGRQVAAGQFRVGSDGMATVPIAIAPKGAAAMTVTVESAGDIAKPAGTVVLKAATLR
jgi:Anti-sigma-K factor rskA, C-terminal